MGLPHVATADDTISNYSIPKGSVLLANIWWFTHDSATYEEPTSIRPERFLGGKPQRDPRNYVFGFGRRVCTGKLLADSSVWLTVAKSLAALKIGKVSNNNTDGSPVEPEVKFTAGVISLTVQFKASVIARSEQDEELVRRIERTDPWVEGMSEGLVSLE